MDIHAPANSRALARLIDQVEISEHPRFIAEAKAAPDMDTFRRENMLAFTPNPYYRPNAVA